MSTQTDFAALFPDEVVTQARTRLLDVPGLGGTLALITIDNGHDHTRPSTFGPGGLTALNAALDEAFACLLYTSPSPRDRTRSRMPSSA